MKDVRGIAATRDRVEGSRMLRDTTRLPGVSVVRRCGRGMRSLCTQMRSLDEGMRLLEEGMRSRDEGIHPWGFMSASTTQPSTVPAPVEQRIKWKVFPPLPSAEGISADLASAGGSPAACDRRMWSSYEGSGRQWRDCLPGG